MKGTNMGPYEPVRHILGVSGHELSCTANRHFSIVLLNEAVADLANAHAQLDISQSLARTRASGTCRQLPSPRPGPAR
ncbi:Tn3 family transposase [Streptomyces platensis]